MVEWDCLVIDELALSGVQIVVGRLVARRQSGR